MRFSIIIPTHNRPKELHDILKKLSLVKDIQVVVVENGSTQKNKKTYLKIIKLYDFVEYYSISIPDVSSARNYGLIKAKGEYSFFLDDDDTPTDSFLKLLSTCNLTKNIYRLPYLFHKNNELITRPNFKFSTLKKYQLFDAVHVSTFIFKTNIIKINNAFIVGHVYEDHSFASYIASSKLKQHIIRIPSMIYTYENVSITRPSKKQTINIICDSFDELIKRRLYYDLPFAFNMITDAYRVSLREKRFRESHEEVRNKLLWSFAKIKNWDTFRKLPIYYKFVFIKWSLMKK